MNQHDQMREALRQNVRAFRHIKTGAIQYTLGNELESDWEDVMIIPNVSNEVLDTALAAEPAPLVRLTDDDIDNQFKRECWVSTIFADGTRGIALDKVTARDFANAIMDAMERVNRRQLDQTPKTPSE